MFFHYKVIKCENISVKCANMWKLNKTFLSNPWIKGEIIREVMKYLRLNDNKNIKYQNLWDSVKAVLRGKCVPLNVDVSHKENSKTNI